MMLSLCKALIASFRSFSSVRSLSSVRSGGTGCTEGANLVAVPGRRLLVAVLTTFTMLFSVSAMAERSLEIDLSLDPSLQQYEDKTWTVFVFAKPLNSRVPVASKKLKLNQLPMKVILTEKNYLLENLTLANADQVIVAAKAVRHDSPHKTVVGDLLGETPAVSFTDGDSQRVVLVISKEVK